jgi:FixJ family two-component response regulator
MRPSEQHSVSCFPLSLEPIVNDVLPCHSNPSVLVVDDDPSMRAALDNLFRSVGLKVQTFESAREVLASKLLDVAGCLVLDVRMPGLSGLNLQAELAKGDVQIPIIVMTSYGDIPMSVRAMKAGAVDFLAKPFRDQDMLDAVSAALDRDRKRRESEIASDELRARFESLTPRERDIMTLVTSGLMNKNAAAEIGLKEITVKLHRAQVMKKMRAKSFADLVRMANALGVRAS